MDWQVLDSNGAPVPVTEEQLRGMVRLGHLKRSTLLWHSGLPDWTPADVALPELFPSLNRSEMPGFHPKNDPVVVVPPQPVNQGPPRGRVGRPVKLRTTPQRKSGGMLKWAGVFLAAVIALSVWRVFNTAKPPGYEELKKAEEALSGASTRGSGDTAGEQKAAEAMAQIAQLLRDAGISKGSSGLGFGKSRLVRGAAAALDADGFSALCTVRGDTAVFLLHVPDVRKFSDDAKSGMGDMAWYGARMGWTVLPEPRPVRLCVAIKGIAQYDRVIEGLARPPVLTDDVEQSPEKMGEGIQSTVTGSDCQKKIAYYFTIPAGKAKSVK